MAESAASPFWIFLRRFLKSPRSVGSIAPSSRFLAVKMVEAVEWRPGVKVVEFGPGTGPFTEEISRRLPESGRYLGIERDPVFVKILKQRFPALDVQCESVTELLEIASRRGLLPVDHIVSGLPFASLPADLTLQILDATVSALRPGGTFTTFQYVHAYQLPAARSFRGEMRRRLGPISARKIELLNFPPAFVFTWRKDGRGGKLSPALS